MVENGHALAIMGNHELNAVASATPRPGEPGAFLREHSDKNQNQHQASLDQVGEGSETHQQIIAWFKTLPLFAELDGFRVVHACWHVKHLKTLGPILDEQNRLRDHVNLLAKLVPLIIELIMANPDTLWGDACYPVVEYGVG